MQKEKFTQESKINEDVRENANKRFIVRRSSIHHVEKIYVDDETYLEWDRFVSAHRKKAQRNGECLCPKNKIWQCDTICDECPFYNKFKFESLDASQFEEDGSSETKADYIVDPTTENFEERIILQLTIEHLIDELKEKDPDIGLLLSTLYEEMKNNTFTNLSDIYKNQGVCKPTFFKRIKKLRKILEESGLKK